MSFSQPQVSAADIANTGNSVRVPDFPNMSKFASDNGVGIPVTPFSKLFNTDAVAAQFAAESARRSMQPGTLGNRQSAEATPVLYTPAQRQYVLIGTLAGAGVALLLYSFFSCKPILE